MSVIDPQTWRDAEDGRALRELAAACCLADPFRSWIEVEWRMQMHLAWTVTVERHIVDPGPMRFDGRTIAEAADKARAALR